MRPAAELDLVEQMGKIGVIFLMFFIGLELSGDLIKKMGALMIGGGALQVGLSVAAVTVVLVFCVAIVGIKLFGTGAAAAIFRRPFPVVASSALVLAQVHRPDTGAVQRRRSLAIAARRSTCSDSVMAERNRSIDPIADILGATSGGW
jgi:hypothetical protein